MLEIDLPARFESVAVACEAVERFSEDAGWHAADVTRVVLAVGEAVGNAVEHGRGTVTLSAGFDDAGTLRVSIADEGPGPKHGSLDAATLPAPDATEGRGLYILAELTDHVAVDAGGVLCLTFAPRA